MEPSVHPTVDTAMGPNPPEHRAKRGRRFSRRITPPMAPIFEEAASPLQPSPTETLRDPVEYIYIRPKDPAAKVTVGKYISRKARVVSETVEALSKKVQRSGRKKVKKMRHIQRHKRVIKMKRRMGIRMSESDEEPYVDSDEEEFYDSFGPDWNKSARPDKFIYESNRDDWIVPPRIVRYGMVIFPLEKSTGPLLRADCEYTFQSFLAHLYDTQVYIKHDGEIVTFRQVAFSWITWVFLAFLACRGLYGHLLFLVSVVVRSFLGWIAITQKHRSWTGHKPKQKQKKKKRNGGKVRWKPFWSFFFRDIVYRYWYGLIIIGWILWHSLCIAFYKIPVPKMDRRKRVSGAWTDAEEGSHVSSLRESLPSMASIPEEVE
ncbi:hypothetical protein IAT40_001060 [Kwoniella sp. CBS 6097]